MNNLATAYNTQNISFLNLGSDNINNDSYYSASFSFSSSSYQNLYNQLVATNSKNNSINIYLLGDNCNLNGGQASGIPGNACVVGGSYSSQNGFPNAGTSVQPFVSSLVTAHEVGHCLGLYHTFETYFGSEFVNESNCTTAGDLVCDTPAESPNYRWEDNSNCQWLISLTDSNGQNYSPDPHNIMGYTRPSCLQYITGGQGTRIRSVLGSSSTLSGLIATPTITGPTVVCSSAYYAVSPSCSSVTWSSSNPNGLSVNSSTGAATRVNNYNGQVTVTATVSGGGCSTSVSQNVWVGQPGSPLSLNKNINNPPFCVGATVIASINPVGGASSYSWVSNNLSMLEASGSSTYVNLQAIASGTCTFSVTVSNTCATTGKSYFTSIQDCSGGGGMYMTSYPNPSSTTMTVSVTDSLSKGNEGFLPQPYQLSLFNHFGNTVYSVQSDLRTIQLPVGSLPPGIYYLNVFYKEAVLRKQVVIER